MFIIHYGSTVAKPFNPSVPPFTNLKSEILTFRVNNERSWHNVEVFNA